MTKIPIVFFLLLHTALFSDVLSSKIKQYINDKTHIIGVLTQNNYKKFLAKTGDETVLDITLSPYIATKSEFAFTFTSTPEKYITFTTIDSNHKESKVKKRIRRSSIELASKDLSYPIKPQSLKRVKSNIITDIYGDINVIEGGISLKLKNSSNTIDNTANIPIRIKSELAAKSIALFATNKSSHTLDFICKWDMHNQYIIDYEIGITLSPNENNTSRVIAILEAKNGNFYLAERTFMIVHD